MRLRRVQALNTFAEPGALPEADNCRVFSDIREAQVSFPVGRLRAMESGMPEDTYIPAVAVAAVDILGIKKLVARSDDCREAKDS